MKGKCECGADRPYRRAYKCLKCWEALPTGIKARLLTARKFSTQLKDASTGTLSLRGMVFNRG